MLLIKRLLKLLQYILCKYLYKYILSWYMLHCTSIQENIQSSTFCVFLSITFYPKWLWFMTIRSFHFFFPFSPFLHAFLDHGSYNLAKYFHTQIRRIITKYKHYSIVWDLVFIDFEPIWSFIIEENKIRQGPLSYMTYKGILCFFKSFSLCLWESSFNAFLDTFLLPKITFGNLLVIFSLFP